MKTALWRIDTNNAIDSDADIFQQSYILDKTGCNLQEKFHSRSNQNTFLQTAQRSARAPKRPQFYAESLKKHLARLTRVSNTTSDQPTVQEDFSSTQAEAALWRQAL